jgi:hypothetical protein
MGGCCSSSSGGAPPAATAPKDVWSVTEGAQLHAIYQARALIHPTKRVTRNAEEAKRRSEMLMEQVFNHCDANGGPNDGLQEEGSTTTTTLIGLSAEVVEAQQVIVVRGLNGALTAVNTINFGGKIHTAAQLHSYNRNPHKRTPWCLVIPLDCEDLEVTHLYPLSKTSVTTGKHEKLRALCHVRANVFHAQVVSHNDHMQLA